MRVIDDQERRLVFRAAVAGLMAAAPFLITGLANSQASLGVQLAVLSVAGLFGELLSR